MLDTTINVPVQEDNSTNWTSDEWTSWVSQEVESRGEAYILVPKDIISAYNNEQVTRSDYHGRELLELLQNADDAGENAASGECNVRIVVQRAGLLIANTGVPFSKGGVESLMVTNNSPKLGKRSRYIGNRGLGFRAVLDWSTCPFILSGNLALGFDANYAATWLQALCESSSLVSKKITQFRADTGIANPIATLVVPMILDADDSLCKHKPKAEGFEELWQAAKALRSSGYTTVIGLPFTTPTTHQETEGQLEQVASCEAILFTRHINRLVIQRQGSTTSWQVQRHDTMVQITSETAGDQIWDIRSMSGEIPLALLSESQLRSPEFEIKLAFPLDDVQLPALLFSYFHTKVLFPFPFIAHGTFELTSNRQNLVESTANRFLLSKLAELIVSVAENEGAQSSDPWRALSMVAPSGSLDPMLRTLGFEEVLTSAIRKARLIPVHGGGRVLVIPKGVVRLPENVSFEEWLPINQFKDVVPSTQNTAIRQLLQRLAIPTLDEPELRSRLNTVSPDLQLEERADLIVGLLKANLLPRFPPPRLLLDSAGQLIPEDRTSFIQPRDSKLAALPLWVDQRLLNGGLSDLLQAKLGVSNLRELRGRLPQYEIQEYQLTTLVRAVNIAVEREVSAHRDKESELRKEALLTFYSLYTQGGTDLDAQKPAGLSISCRTRAGTFRSASELYFSGEYPSGALTEALYGSFAPGRMIAPLEDLGLPAELGPLPAERFLRWLGVNDAPRVVKILPDTDFVEYVKGVISYPVRTSWDTHEAADRHALFDCQIKDLISIDSLHQVLQHADPHAVLAWVATDTRIEQWRLKQDPEAKLLWKPGANYKHRQMTGQTVPSYVIRKLETAAWIPTTSDKLCRPTECTLEADLSGEVRAFLPRPALNLDNDLLVRYAVDKGRLHRALEICGVARSVVDIGWGALYRVLLDLPALDPDGTSAKNIYRLVLSRGDQGDDPLGDKYKQFMANGRLWSKLGGVPDYRPIQELYYDPSGLLPEYITREFALLEVDRRKNVGLVLKLLGVRALERSSVKLEVRPPQLSQYAAGFSEEILSLKPYIFLRRAHPGPGSEHRNRVKALTITLCDSATARAVIEGRPVEVSLLEAGDVFLDGETVYMKAPATPDQTYLLRDDLLADALGQLMAELLEREDISSDIARLASCLPSSRNDLLARMLGVPRDEVLQLLSAAKQKLDIAPDLNEHEYVWRPASPRPDAAITASVHGYGGEGGDNTEDGVAPREVDPELKINDLVSRWTGGGRPEIVELTEKEHIVAPPRRELELVITNVPVRVNLSARPHRRADSALGEMVAYEFESAPGQDRYPERVDHLRGNLGFGCDILSFRSAEDRAKWQAAQDMSLVSRFIEVKSSVRASGEISLAGNEHRSARKYGERYHLYRVYGRPDGTFEILTLSNPTALAEDISLNVDLRRANMTQCWQAVVAIRDTET